MHKEVEKFQNDKEEGQGQQMRWEKCVMVRES